MAQSSAAKNNGYIGNLEPYQEAFATETNHRYVGFVSGVGAGKTYAGIARTVANMMQWNTGEMGAIVAPARRMIIDVIIPEMRAMGLFDPPFNWEYNSAHAEQPGIHTPDGSRALLLSADNSKTIERLAGLNLAWAWLDEAAKIDPRARQILMQRLRVGAYRNLYITTTPLGKNHTFEFWAEDIPEDESYTGLGKLYSDGTTMSIVGVPTDGNRELPKDYTEAMKADMPDAVRAQEVQGEFVEIGTGILTYEMLSTVPAKELEGKEFRYHVAVDLGIETNPRKAKSNDTDYWSMAVVGVNRKPTRHDAYLFAVRRRRGQAPSEAAEWIRQEIESLNLPTRTVRYESVQAQSWFESDLKDHGLKPIPIEPKASKEDRIIGLSVPFSNAQVQLVDWSDVPAYSMDWSDFKSEWASFPDGSHDDQLDSVSMALDPVDFGQRLPGRTGDMYGRNDE